MLDDILNLLDNKKSPLPEKDEFLPSHEEIDRILLKAWEESLDRQDESLKSTRFALQASLKSAYVPGQATAHRNLAYLKMLSSEYRNSIEEVQTCLSLVEESDFPQLCGTAWDILALCYNGLGLYEASVESTYKSLGLFEQAGYTRGIAWAYHNLGIVFTSLSDYSKANEEFKKALPIFTELDHKYGISRISHLMGRTARLQGDYQGSIKLLNRAIDIASYDEDSTALNNLHMELGMARRLMKDYEASEEEFKGCRDKLRIRPNKEMQGQLEYETALLCRDNNRIEEAFSHLNTALQLSRETEIKSMEKQVEHTLSELNEQQGDSRAALRHYKNYDRLSSELLSTESLQKINSLRVQKEVELAEREKNYHKKLQEEAEKILINVLPASIVEELRDTGMVTPRSIDEATVIFTDFVGFTDLSSRSSPAELITELDHCFSAFDRIMEDLGIEKLKTIGDGYMAVAGVPDRHENHAALCVQAGLKIRDFMNDYVERRNREGKSSWNVRIGIHSGSLIAGVIGRKKFAFDIWGDTVNTASRIESGGQEGAVNISSATKKLTGDRFEYSNPYTFLAKGKGELEYFTVFGEKA